MANMSLEKIKMPEQAPDVRNKNFEEVAMGYTAEMAMEEATRCPNCKTQIQPPKKALEMAGIPENPGKLYWQGAGCDQCFHSGYRGRIGVFEVMLIQEELRRCILEGADRTRFLEAARRASQYVPMLEHAQKLVEEGVSTVDEVIRTLLAL